MTAPEHQHSPDLSQELKTRELQLREVKRQMQQLIGQLGDDTSPPAPQPLAAPLSPREFDILRLIAAGATNPQIGRELRLSSGTIRNYNGHIFRKLGVASRTQAAVRAIELGIVRRPETHEPR